MSMLNRHDLYLSADVMKIGKGAIQSLITDYKTTTKKVIDKLRAPRLDELKARYTNNIACCKVAVD